MTPEDKVAAGVDYLDRAAPDWWQRIDNVSTLAAVCRPPMLWCTLRARHSLPYMPPTKRFALGFSVDTREMVAEEQAWEAADALADGWAGVIRHRRPTHRRGEWIMSDLPIRDLRESGLLWLINRVVFHPRGFALAMAYRDDGEFMYWVLQGDGSQPWTFDGDEDDLFRSVEETFAEAVRLAGRTAPTEGDTT